MAVVKAFNSLRIQKNTVKYYSDRALMRTPRFGGPFGYQEEKPKLGVVTGSWVTLSRAQGI
jgi:hypothetical protein